MAHHNHLWLATAFAATLAFASPCAAGCGSGRSVASAMNEEAGKAYDKASFANLINLPKGVEVSTEDEATKISFKVAHDCSMTGDLVKDASSNLNGAFLYRRWSLGAEGLIDTPDGPVKLASLDGLARSANIEFKFQLINGHVQIHPDESVDVDLNRLTFAAKAGVERFEFSDPTTLAKTSQRKSPWSVSLGYTMINQAATDLFTVAATYEQAYTPLDKKILCPAGGAPDKCVNVIPGPPKDERGTIVSAEYRRIFNQFAMSVKVAHDTQTDVTGVEIPIYFPAVADGSFNAGVKLGWRSDTDEAVAAFFVNKPLSMAFFD